MIRWFYAVLMTLAQPLLRRKLRRRGQIEPGYLEAMDERFGRYGSRAEPAATPAACVWVHAVSLGETRAAAVLIAALRQQIPGMRLLLTHGTATGRAEGRALLRDGDMQAWQPWDAPGAVRRFLDHFQPRVGILLETEIWPTLTAACAARGIPLLLVNARLSEKSLRKALQLAWLARPAYRALTAVCAQTQADADRLAQLGAPVRGVLGNVKFDAQPDPALLARGRQWRAAWDARSAPQPQPQPISRIPPQAIVLFASSREGEEALLLQHIAALPPAQRNAVQWLIVPRHPQRFDDVAALVQAQGFGLSRRSQWAADGLPSTGAKEGGANEGGATEIWLGDSLGEMPLYFALSDLALLGGSFLPLGGQNLIEAAACACPVVMGPHTFNFAEAAQNSAAAGAAFRVDTLPLGLATVFELLQNKEQLNDARRAATAFIALHRGAAGKTAAAIAQWV